MLWDPGKSTDAATRLSTYKRGGRRGNVVWAREKIVSIVWRSMFRSEVVHL
jgi:hypothetical protein